MVLNCANPSCSAKFLYLHEGTLVLLELPNRTVERYWLCGACSPSMRVIFRPGEGVRVVSKHASKNLPQQGMERGESFSIAA